MPKKGDLIGEAVSDLAEEKSQGKCWEYVRKGIQKALGKPIQGTGIESAKDCGPWLENVGYKETGSKNYKNGDVMVIDSDAKHKHGHVQVYY